MGTAIQPLAASSTEMPCCPSARLHNGMPRGAVKNVVTNPGSKAHWYLHVVNVAMYKVWLPCAELEVSFTSATTDVDAARPHRNNGGKIRNSSATKAIVLAENTPYSRLESPPCATRASVWLYNTPSAAQCINNLSCLIRILELLLASNR